MLIGADVWGDKFCRFDERDSSPTDDYLRPEGISYSSSYYRYSKLLFINFEDFSAASTSS